MAVPPRMNLRKLTKDQLLDGTERAHRQRIRLLLDDPDVHRLVLLESHHGERQIQGVGPNYKYRSVLSLLAADLGTFSPTATYDKTDEDFGKTPAPGPGESGRIAELEAELADLGHRYKLMAQAHDVAQLQLGQLKEASQLQAAGFERRNEDLSRSEQLLAEREEALAEMEEALVARMDEHMQKLAEMEQREEELFARERRLPA